MASSAKLTEKEWHRKNAKNLFNHTWTLMERRRRTKDEDDEMLNSAYASRYHWSRIGDPVNFARGEWQISRVYSLLKRPEPSLHHAKRCLKICQDANLGAFDLAFAYEALARASAIAGRKQDSRNYLAKARRAGTNIQEKEDSDWLQTNLKTIPGL
jgi:hypothetical protein